MKQPLALTGGTGHLGTVLAHTLLAHRNPDRELVTPQDAAADASPPGSALRCVVRSGRRIPGLEEHEATGRLAYHELSLQDLAGLTRAFEGVSTVIHAAGLVSFMPGRRRELHRVNVEGTRRALLAAERAGVRRFLYVGSVEAFPLEHADGPVTEELPLDPGRTVMAYGWSKALAMQEVLGGSPATMERIVCCPTAFLGPPDYRGSPIGSFVRDTARGRLPVAISGGFDFVDVRDVATGILAAVERGRDGACYLLGGRYVTVPEMVRLVAAEAGVPGPAVTLPLRAVQPFTPLVEGYYALSGRPPRFTRSSLRLLSLGVRVDTRRAEAELDYHPRPIAETIRDTVAWFSRNGDINL